MKLQGWLIAGALSAGTVVFAMKGCASKADPDERLAGRFEKICGIMRANAKTPESGVRALGAYLGDHAGDITGELGETIAMIEKIPNDAKHDARARLAGKRLRAAGCSSDVERFADAVARDPAAAALYQRASERLGRTFELILGQSARGLSDPSKLMDALGHAD